MWQLHFPQNKGKQEQAVNPFHTPFKGGYIAQLSWGVTLFLMICCIKHWYQTMDLGLPFHSCTFDDITMTSSGFRGNPIFFYNSLFLKKWNHSSNSNFASSISMIISKKITLAFEDNCFCFQVRAFLYQKSEFLFKMFIKSTLYLTKRPTTRYHADMWLNAIYWCTPLQHVLAHHYTSCSMKPII